MIQLYWGKMKILIYIVIICSMWIDKCPSHSHCVRWAYELTLYRSQTCELNWNRIVTNEFKQMNIISDCDTAGECYSIHVILPKQKIEKFFFPMFWQLEHIINPPLNSQWPINTRRHRITGTLPLNFPNTPPRTEIQYL